MIIGICARLDNSHDDLMSQLPTLPALLLVAIGAVGSFVGFIGFLGAVRESFCLLKMVKIYYLKNTSYIVFLFNYIFGCSLDMYSVVSIH